VSKKKGRKEMNISRAWLFGIVAVIILVLVGVIIPRTLRTDSPSTPTSVPSLLEIPRISLEELKVKFDAGDNIAIVDTRSNKEYEESHIPGAISIPGSAISQRYGELSGYDEIVTYCT
jgi:hypothetical protein